MSDRPSDRVSDGKVSFWSTLPGILTGFAGVITAVGALIVALNSAGLFPQKTPPSNPSSPQPGAISADQTSGSFLVYARYTSKFENPSQEPKTILFQASGQWLAIPAEENPTPNGLTSPQGYTDRVCDERCPYPGQALGALVGLVGDQDYFLIGEEKKVTLAGGQSIKLFMNDVANLYDDNEGGITVKWSFVK